MFLSSSSELTYIVVARLDAVGVQKYVLFGARIVIFIARIVILSEQQCTSTVPTTHPHEALHSEGSRGTGCDARLSGMHVHDLL